MLTLEFHTDANAEVGQLQQISLVSPSCSRNRSTRRRLDLYLGRRAHSSFRLRRLSPNRRPSPQRPPPIPR
jgi:hypothetical protein